MERVECNRSKTNGEITTTENVKRCKSNPIAVPKRTSYHELMEDDLMDMYESRRRKSTPILHKKFDDNDVDHLFKSINVDENIFSNSLHLRNRRSSSPFATDRSMKSTLNHADDESQNFKTINRRETSKSFTCANFNQNQDDGYSSQINLVNNSDTSTYNADRSSNNSSNNSNHSSPTMSSKSRMSSNSKKKLSGHASPAIEKQIVRYNTAVENWNNKTTLHLQKKILANERKDSSESNDSLNFELDHSSQKISHKEQLFIASKKKSLVEKFEKLSSGGKIKRRRPKSNRKKSLVDNYTSKEEHSEEGDKFLLNEKEKISTKRRFSLGIPLSKDDNDHLVSVKKAEIDSNQTYSPSNEPDFSNENNDDETTSVSATSTDYCNYNGVLVDDGANTNDTENKNEKSKHTPMRKRSYVVLNISRDHFDASSMEYSEKIAGGNNSIKARVRRHSHFIPRSKESVHIFAKNIHKHEDMKPLTGNFKDSKIDDLPIRKRSQVILNRNEVNDIMFVPDKTIDYPVNLEKDGDIVSQKEDHSNVPIRKRSQVILNRNERYDITFVPDERIDYPENLEKDENIISEKEDHSNVPIRKQSHVILNLKDLSALNSNPNPKDDLDADEDVSDPLTTENCDLKDLPTHKYACSRYGDIDMDTKPSSIVANHVDIASDVRNKNHSTSHKDDDSSSDYESDFSYDDPRRISVVRQNINVPLMRKRSHLIQGSPFIQNNGEFELHEQALNDSDMKEDKNSPANLNYFSENSEGNKLFTLGDSDDDQDDYYNRDDDYLKSVSAIQSPDEDSDSNDFEKSYSSGSGHRKISVIEAGALPGGSVRKRSTVAMPIPDVRHMGDEFPVMHRNHQNSISNYDLMGYANDNVSDYKPYDYDNPSAPSYKTLSELRSGSVIGITDRSNSFGSSPGDCYEMSRKVSFDEESVQNTIPRRKNACIVSLEELPKRRMSRVAEWFEANESQELPSYESCYIPEMVSRKISMFGQFLTFDDMNDRGLEVVASKETRDIISQSHGTISSCSDASPYRPPLRSDVSSHSFDKIPISEEPEKDEEDYIASFLPAFSEDGDTDSSDGNTSDESTDTVKGPVTGMPDGIQHSSRQEQNTSIIQDGILYEVKTHIDDRKSTTFSTMFGYFNYCLYNFIIKEYSDKNWKEIVLNLNLTSKQKRMFEKPRHQLFDDLVTHKVLQNASEMMFANSPISTLLQKFGISYFNWCCARYGDLLKSIATNLADFINNMDDIRRFIHKVEKIADDYPPSVNAIPNKQGTLLLYYHSNRDQIYLDHFMMGFIKQVALILFGMNIRVRLQKPRERPDDFSIISIKDSSKIAFVKKPSVSKLQVSSRCQDLILEPYLMDSIFPFHLILDENLKISQLGNSLNRLLENYIPSRGLDLLTYFKVVKPVLEDFSFETICNNLNTAFILSTHNDLFLDVFANGLVLKGQITYLESSKSLWFIASPKVDLLNQLNGESNLYLSDIPLHDATRELLLVSEQVHAQDRLKSQLQVLTNRLKETSKQLALGKINTENVLDEIFPKDVADKLMRDQPVPAVTAEEVSVLFTDIVGFTAICGNCEPEDVTIMLNELYLSFDFLCEKYDLYKVETIGDAYMAVGGLHRKRHEHGRFTTAMGIEMITQAKGVCTPAGDEIQIRVGIHSGSVVAGVVGTKMPRYCLFGNNVTFANKMESTSESCKVHISPATYLEIKHHQEFIFFERPRDVMPSLMQKLYKGHTYFVSQRRPSLYQIPGMENERRYQYMKLINDEEEYVSRGRGLKSRKTSHSESVVSDYSVLPSDLREQLTALKQIGLNGKLLCVQENNDVI